jgi:hypothetical protein
MYQLTDHGLNAGLPDGIFSNRKIPIWVNFGGYILWLFGQLQALWFSLCPFILWSFGIVCPLWCIVPRKIWQPCLNASLLACKNKSCRDKVIS